MQPAAPDPAARLLTVVEAVAARAEEALQRLDELSAAVDATPAPPHPARLAAIELAVSGASRADTATHLRERFPDEELDAVLDDVFG
jgi:hypothetical protein